MPDHLLSRQCRAALAGLVVIVACHPYFLAQEQQHGKIVGGYFEEWNIHYSGRNIADLEKNGVADQLSHLIYAFGNVTATSAPVCAIADPMDAYQDPSVPSVNGKAFTAPVYGNYGAIQQLKQLHPHLKVLISLGGQAGNNAGWVAAGATPAGRAALASSCIDLFVKGNIAPGVQAPRDFRRIQSRLGVSGRGGQRELHRIVERVSRATQRLK